jgi:hypothetical protein
MIKWLVLFNLLIAQVYSEDGTSILLKNAGSEIDLTNSLKTQKALTLDDPFKVQLFGQWKASQLNLANINDWVNLVLANEFEKALLSYSSIEKDIPAKFQKSSQTAMAYLAWKLNLNQIFLNAWFDLVQSNDFLQSEMGIALDIIVSKNATSWLRNNGVILSEEQKAILNKIKNSDSQFYNSLQAWAYKRTGEKGIEWVKKLDEKDPLRLELIYSAITDYAVQGKLAVSGQLIKKAVEPIIDESKDSEQIAQYYITLGRLLYQAGAFEESNMYYELIPESSKYFLSAQTESVWSLIQLNDLSRAKGKLATLNLDLFDANFLPEIYLTRSIVNLKTCQFDEVKNDLKRFVNVNTVWANKISQNLREYDPAAVNMSEPATINLSALEKSLKLEETRLAELFKTATENKAMEQYSRLLAQLESDRINLLKQENKRQWENRKRILEDNIYRMKFVRIEFLSQMRNLALNIPLSNTDQIKMYQAAPARNNELVFPNDGVLWGDDLFNISADVKNLCLRNLK